MNRSPPKAATGISIGLALSAMKIGDDATVLGLMSIFFDHLLLTSVQKPDLHAAAKHRRLVIGVAIGVWTLAVVVKTNAPLLTTSRVHVTALQHHSHHRHTAL